MPVDIDGYEVLGAIARRPEVFEAIRGEIVKTARALVVRQLKDKGLAIEGLKAVAAAIDREAFDLVVDAMPDADIKSLLAKLDKQNADIKAAPPQEQRRHVVALATGAAAPSAKPAPVKAQKPAKPAKPPVERAGNSKAMRAVKKV